MKRIMILLMAIGLVAAFPAIALADRPAPPTAEVTITGHIDTTGCSTGPLTMNYLEKRLHTLDAFDQAWATECVYLTLNGLEGGCYCGHHPDNEDSDAGAGLFRLNEQRDGTVELISQFDRKWVKAPHPSGKGTRSVLESCYSLNGVLEGDFAWTQASGGGTLIGSVELKYFYKEVGTNNATWTFISETPVTIDVSW